LNTYNIPLGSFCIKRFCKIAEKSVFGLRIGFE
jgi:hypothetical protein